MQYYTEILPPSTACVNWWDILATALLPRYFYVADKLRAVEITALNPALRNRSYVNNVPT